MLFDRGFSVLLINVLLLFNLALGTIFSVYWYVFGGELLFGDDIVRY